MLYIVDLDGTICSILERLKEAGPEPFKGDKEAKQAWVDRMQNQESLAKDEPISPVCAIVRNLKSASHQIVFLTGRSEDWKSVTQTWLNRFNLRNIPLYMRESRDWRPAGEYKREQILKILKIYQPDVACALDDDPSDNTRQVYEELGITFMKVFESTKKLTKKY